VAACGARPAAGDAGDRFLGSAPPEAYARRLPAFHQALKETGYVEGQNVAIEYRWAQGRSDRLRALAAELVRRQVALIVAAGSSSALAARAETTNFGTSASYLHHVSTMVAGVPSLAGHVVNAIDGIANVMERSQRAKCSSLGE
jgi:hypothetical protein